MKEKKGYKRGKKREKDSKEPKRIRERKQKTKNLRV